MTATFDYIDHKTTHTADRMCHFGPVVLLPVAEGATGVLGLYPFQIEKVTY